jgi:hydrocephalus-inducing protein
VDNQYEDSLIQLVGEGYQDDVTIDNVRQLVTYVDPENEEGNNAEDDVAGKWRVNNSAMEW